MNRFRVRLRCHVAPLALVLMAGAFPALGQTCSVSSTGANFGNYDYANGNSTTGTVTLNCSLALLNNVTLALSAGVASGATTSNRMMSQQLPAGADRLNYGLFQNATVGPLCAGGIVWGNTAATEPAPIGTLLILPAFPHSWTVYACLPANQDVTVATYADTVTATVAWQ
jgi:spore coat protein U-like protein